MGIFRLLTIVAVVGTSVPFGLAQDASSFRTLTLSRVNPTEAIPRQVQ